MRRTTTIAGRRSAVLAIGLIASLMLVACSSSSGTSSPDSPSAATSAGRAGDGAGLAAAESGLAPYTGHPSGFPVNQPLRSRPQHATWDLVQCSTPVCALFAQIIKGAAETLGVKLNTVPSGASASSAQAAMDTVISAKPTGVIIPGVTPQWITAQLRQLNQSHIPVVSIGAVNARQYGIDFDNSTAASVELAGKLLADWVIVQKGAKANVVFYQTPELPFMAYELQGFTQQLRSLCVGCALRTVTVPVATIGNGAPSQVVSDLQANPSTNVAVFGTEEAATGLPAALKAAGISVTTTGFAPTPANLQDIKSGGLTSGLATDLPVGAWETVDALARLSAGQAISSYELNTPAPLQMLERSDITFNPANGWTGYPDFAQRFAKLWGVG